MTVTDPRRARASSSAEGTRPSPSKEAPDSQQRADGHVERSARVHAVLHRLGDEVEQLMVDGDRRAARRRVQAGERAVAPVEAREPIDAIHFVECRFERRLRSVGIERVRDDRVDAPHRLAARRHADGCTSSDARRCCLGLDAKTMRTAAASRVLRLTIGNSVERSEGSLSESKSPWVSRVGGRVADSLLCDPL